MQPIAQPPSRAGSLPLIGSDLAFDFANTCTDRDGPEYVEHFHTPEHVVAWARHAKVLSSATGELISQAIAKSPASGRELLRRALELRQIIFEIGNAIVHGKQPVAAQTDALARIHATCVARARLVPFQSNFVWQWRPKGGIAEAILGPVTLSALTLLAQADVSRIKQCGGEHCGWLFLDTTKNKRRRWCEMEVCGNRAKQKAHRARVQALK